MGISTFPAADGGAVNNDFVVDMNETTDNTITLPRAYGAGAYAITLSSGDTSYDVYFLDSSGSAVGYSNSASIVASDVFETVVILGVATTEVISFGFSGAATNPTAAGEAVGAGAYLVSISPSDLPDTDDTANVVGGNFSTAVEINFTSGTSSLPAKNIVRTDSTALVVTRPDALVASGNPWSLEAINPGVTPPTGSDAHILAGTITAGSGVSWVTTSPLTLGTAGSAYSVTLEATDPDGTAITYAITSGTFPGLSLNSDTGVLSGTPTAGATATVTATDSGGNTADRDFYLPVQIATGGSVSLVDGYITHVFTSTDDFVPQATISDAEYLIIGGGGGGAGGSYNTIGGGGGAGGYLSSISGETGAGGSAISTAISFSVGTVVVTVGAGGNAGAYPNVNGGQGGSSSIAGYATAIGGGAADSGSGGSGGGGGNGATGGTGTPGQGFNGGSSVTNNTAGAGGGAGQAGGTSTSLTPGISSSATGSAVQYAQGGGAGAFGGSGTDGTNLGSGGGGRRAEAVPGAGVAGLVVIRY